jgi:hypothetical protein
MRSACRGPLRLQDQAVQLAGLLCVVLDSLAEVLVDGHGLLLVWLGFVAGGRVGEPGAASGL